MVWEIKVCRKCIKNLMSSSKASVCAGSKREALTNGSDSGVSRERREGQERSGWSGMQRLRPSKGEVSSVPGVCWRWECGASLGATLRGACAVLGTFLVLANNK